MDSPEQAQAYARANFQSANDLFVDTFDQRFGHPGHGALVVDMGCGPADIPIRFLRNYSGSFIHAVDGSKAMLEHARRSVEEAGLDHAIRIYCKELPRDDLPAGGYDVLLSNSLLHHLHDPGALWFMIQSYGRKGAPVCVMDLFRPENEDDARGLVDRYAAEEPEVLRTDFYNSLLAAFRPEEVQGQLDQAGLKLDVEPVSDRHMVISGTL